MNLIMPYADEIFENIPCNFTSLNATITTTMTDPKNNFETIIVNDINGLISHLNNFKRGIKYHLKLDTKFLFPTIIDQLFYFLNHSESICVTKLTFSNNLFYTLSHRKNLAESLKNGLKENKNLKKLYLGFLCFNKEHMKIISKAFKVNTSIKTFGITCRLFLLEYDGCLHYFLNKSLTNIKFDFQYLIEDEVTKLSKYLKSEKCKLLNLNLYSKRAPFFENYSKNMYSLLEALVYNQSVRRLKIFIIDYFKKKNYNLFKKVLKENKYLKKLYVIVDYLDEEEFNEFIDCLKSNESIENLTIVLKLSFKYLIIPKKILEIFQMKSLKIVKFKNIMNNIILVTNTKKEDFESIKNNKLLSLTFHQSIWKRQEYEKLDSFHLLTMFSNLSSLNLSNSSMDGSVFDKLCDDLYDNKTIENLNFSYMEIKHSYLDVKIAELLRKNNIIKNLDISYISLFDKCSSLDIVVNSLRENNSLLTLKMDQKVFCCSTKGTIIKVLKWNTTLLKLTYRTNDYHHTALLTYMNFGKLINSTLLHLKFYNKKRNQLLTAINIKNDYHNDLKINRKGSKDPSDKEFQKRKSNHLLVLQERIYWKPNNEIHSQYTFTIKKKIFFLCLFSNIVILQNQIIPHYCQNQLVYT